MTQVKTQYAKIEGYGILKGEYNAENNTFDVFGEEYKPSVWGCYEMWAVTFVDGPEVSEPVKAKAKKPARRVSEREPREQAYTYRFHVVTIDSRGVIRHSAPTIKATNARKACEIIEKRYPKQFDYQLMYTDNPAENY